jgi:hypothetical protein
MPRRRDLLSTATAGVALTAGCGGGLPTVALSCSTTEEQEAEVMQG